MNVAQFIEHLSKYHNIKLDWKIDMVPKLSRIIIETLNSVSDAIEQRTNSFEVYGFDFVLVYKLDPWLIEVHLSPACCQRTVWLSDMLGLVSFNI